MNPKKITLVLSGGLDSAVLLWHLAANEINHVETVSFNYGQRHKRELQSAFRLAEARNVYWTMLDLRSISQAFQGSSQTDKKIDVPQGHYTDENMKTTVVPNRNMVMLSIAAAWSISRKRDAVAFGCHSGDHAIYPDCRPEFVDAMNKALGICDWRQIELLAPFVGMSKAEIVRRGLQLKVPFEKTWTCYAGERVPCGKCGACVERAEAFAVNSAKDPLLCE